MNAKNINIEQCFKYAALNQKAFDIFYYDMLGLRFDDFTGIPRPMKWASKYAELLPLIKLLGKPLAYLWVYLGFYFYALGFLSFNVVRKLLFGTHVDIRLLASQSIGLYVGERSYTVLTRPDLNPVDFWLSPSGDHHKNKNIISCSDVLSFRDFFICLMMGIRAHKSLIKEGRVKIGWQSYTVFSWMTLWRALNLLYPSKISMTDHHDRWAVLLDLYIQERNNSKDKCLLSLTQHGLEYESTYKRMYELRGAAKLPYLLTAVVELNLYDSSQFEIFSKYILSDSIQESCVINYIGKKIYLSNLNSDRPSLLIVGHKACEEIHLKLYDFLINRLSIDIYYKPHPTVSSSKQAKNAGWNYIENVNYFPRVSCIVSYPSTLAAEYETEGVRVFIHPMSLGMADSLMVFNKIKNMLDHGIENGF